MQAKSSVAPSTKFPITLATPYGPKFVKPSQFAEGQSRDAAAEVHVAVTLIGGPADAITLCELPAYLPRRSAAPILEEKPDAQNAEHVHRAVRDSIGLSE